jgi:hypothetical protein
MRRNPFIRVRRYDQRPQACFSWAEEVDDGGIDFRTESNPEFEREKRMQSWRRPL